MIKLSGKSECEKYSRPLQEFWHILVKSQPIVTLEDGMKFIQS